MTVPELRAFLDAWARSRLGSAIGTVLFEPGGHCDEATVALVREPQHDYLALGW